MNTWHRIKAQARASSAFRLAGALFLTAAIGAGCADDNTDANGDPDADADVSTDIDPGTDTTDTADTEEDTTEPHVRQWGLAVYATEIEITLPEGSDEAQDFDLQVIFYDEQDKIREITLGPLRYTEILAQPGARKLRPRNWSLGTGTHALAECDGAPCPYLITWEPSMTELEFSLRIMSRSGGPAVGWTTTPVTLNVDTEGPLVLAAEHSNGTQIAIPLVAQEAFPLAKPGSLGLNINPNLASPAKGRLGEDYWSADRALRVKVSEGLRPHLLKDGCDSELACAAAGENYPCVDTCACTGPDCDFSAISANLTQRAKTAIADAIGRAPQTDELSHYRVHYVYQRSLGAETNCDEYGELAAPPAAWRPLFAEITRAAYAFNKEAGAPVIDLISPMEAANHPLRDGLHQTAGGDEVYAGVLDLAAAAVLNACDGAADRYLARDFDVENTLIAAFQGVDDARQALLAEDADPALIPTPTLSLALDTDLRDRVNNASIESIALVSPPSDLINALKDIAQSSTGPIGLSLDSFAGSWGSPWYSETDHTDLGTENGPLLLAHFDPESGSVVRVDPFQAADWGLAMTSATMDLAETTWGYRPPTLLGNVGWSLFDNAIGAQCDFMYRLVTVSAELQNKDDQYLGFIWYRDRDAGPFTYPEWDTTTLLGGDDPASCYDGNLEALACSLDLLFSMEDTMGLFGLAADNGWQLRPSWQTFEQGVISHFGPAPLAE